MFPYGLKFNSAAGINFFLNSRLLISSNCLANGSLILLSKLKSPDKKTGILSVDPASKYLSLNL